MKHNGKYNPLRNTPVKCSSCANVFYVTKEAAKDIKEHGEGGLCFKCVLRVMCEPVKVH